MMCLRWKPLINLGELQNPSPDARKFEIRIFPSDIVEGTPPPEPNFGHSLFGNYDRNF
jgi:hypothetical protein